MAKYANSSAEDKFIEIFCELYGPEKGQYPRIMIVNLAVNKNHCSEETPTNEL